MKRRDVIVVVAIAVVAVVGGAWFGLIAPQRAEAGALQERISARQGELQTTREQVRAHRAARKDYAKNYATVAALGKALPPRSDLASLIEQLAETARRTHVRFSNVTSSAAAPTAQDGAAAGAPAPRPFEFSFQGRFMRLSSFLRQLERYVEIRGGRLVVNGRLLTIQGFRLGNGGSGSPAPGAGSGAGSAAITATIRATSYAVSDPLAGATPGGPAPAGGAAAPGADAAPAAGTPPSTNAAPASPAPPAATIGAHP